MSSYRRAITRLMFIGVLISSAVLLNNKPAAAVTCQEECYLQFGNCIHNDCLGGNGECFAVCDEAYGLCLKSC